MSTADDTIALAVAGTTASGAHAPVLRWRAIGERYDADRECVASVRVDGARARMRFQLPKGARVDHVRFVPTCLPGCYAIDRAMASQAPIDDLARRLMSVEGERLEAGAGGLRWSNWQRPAALELDVRGLSSETLEFLLRREGDHAAREELSGQLHALSRAISASEARLAEAQLTQAIRLEGLSAAVEGQRAEQGASRVEQARVHAAAMQGIASDVAGLAAAQEAESARQSARLEDLDARLQAQAKQLGELAHAAERIAAGIENVFWRRWLRRLRGEAR